MDKIQKATNKIKFLRFSEMTGSSPTHNKTQHDAEYLNNLLNLSSDDEFSIAEYLNYALNASVKGNSSLCISFGKL